MMSSGRSEPKMPAPCPCMKIPLFQNFGWYFNISLLIKSFCIATLLNLYLFFAFFGIKAPLLLSFATLFGWGMALAQKRGFWIGFFLSISWFWWIGLSFRYYQLTWMIPLVVLFIGVVYGALFAIGYCLAGRFEQSFLQLIVKALFIFSLGFIHPFGFNWLIPQITFVPTYLSFDPLSFAAMLGILVIMLLANNWKKIVFAPLFLFFIQHHQPPALAPLKIELVTTHLDQDKKWDRTYRARIIQNNFFHIQQAIDKRADVVVLPESAFPLFLNLQTDLLAKLSDLSHKIAIVTGALAYKDGKIFNSTYVFEDGRYIILDKVVLVPFGEEIPLPKFLAKPINEIFFGGSSDYDHAKEPQKYKIKGIWFTNAICYEATHPIIYQTDSPYIIAISNNAWFWPSYEPYLQNMIIRYYATIYKKVVYHATNIAKTEVIR